MSISGAKHNTSPNSDSRHAPHINIRYPKTNQYYFYSIFVGLQKRSRTVNEKIQIINGTYVPDIVVQHVWQYG